MDLKPPIVELASYVPPIGMLIYTSRQDQIMCILEKAEFLKVSDIMQNLTDQLSERTLRNDLKLLKKHGIIAHQGHAKTALWFLITK